MAKSPFKLKSGNSTPFKMMGSSPVKQGTTIEKSLNKLKENLDKITGQGTSPTTENTIVDRTFEPPTPETTDVTEKGTYRGDVATKRGTYSGDAAAKKGGASGISPNKPLYLHGGKKARFKKKVMDIVKNTAFDIATAPQRHIIKNLAGIARGISGVLEKINPDQPRGARGLFKKKKNK
mgnify:FL=1